MNTDYYNSFPNDFLRNIRERVNNNLNMGENVIVASPIGFGIKTLPNLIIRDLQDRFNVIFIDTELVNLEAIPEYIKNSIKKTKKNLVVIKYLEVVKRETIEKIASFQFTGKNVVFLCLSHLEPIKEPIRFNAITDTFFKRVEILIAYDRETTYKAIEINNTFFNFNVSKKDWSSIYELSAGIPRLIKYIALNISEGKYKVGDALNNLYYDPSILFQLDYLTKLLLTENTFILKRIGVLDDKGKIKSLLLKDYFIKFVPQHLVESFTSLSDYELKILSFLYLNKNNVITFEKIGDLVSMNEFNYSLWAIYKQISRIKVKVKNKYIIESVRGLGYRLSER